jgi:hypothetical protein
LHFSVKRQTTTNPSILKKQSSANYLFCLFRWLNFMGNEFSDLALVLLKGSASGSSFIKTRPWPPPSSYPRHSGFSLLLMMR